MEDCPEERLQFASALAPICKRHVPRQKTYHKHPQAITGPFAKTKTLPQASASHHRGICQDKNLTTSICQPSPGHLPRQKPYRKHPRAIAEHLPRQKPYHKNLRTITGAFAKTKTLVTCLQALAPSPSPLALPLPKITGMDNESLAFVSHQVSMKGL